MFEDVFRLTDPAPDARSVIELLRDEGVAGATPRRPGTYNDGLLSILSASHDLSGFGWWPAMTTGRFAAVAYDGYGEFYLWDREKLQVSQLGIQTGAVRRATATIDEFLDEFVVHPSNREGMLLEGFTAQIVPFHGTLRYGQIYIQVPWSMHAGIQTDPRKYDVGDVNVYVSLVGQTHFGSEDGEEA